MTRIHAVNTDYCIWDKLSELSAWHERAENLHQLLNREERKKERQYPNSYAPHDLPFNNINAVSLFYRQDESLLIQHGQNPSSDKTKSCGVLFYLRIIPPLISRRLSSKYGTSMIWYGVNHTFGTRKSRTWSPWGQKVWKDIFNSGLTQWSSWEKRHWLKVRLVHYSGNSANHDFWNSSHTRFVKTISPHPPPNRGQWPGQSDYQSIHMTTTLPDALFSESTLKVVCLDEKLISPYTKRSSHSLSIPARPRFWREDWPQKASMIIPNGQVAFCIVIYVRAPYGIIWRIQRLRTVYLVISPSVGTSSQVPQELANNLGSEKASWILRDNWADLSNLKARSPQFTLLKLTPLLLSIAPSPGRVLSRRLHSRS